MLQIVLLVGQRSWHAAVGDDQLASGVERELVRIDAMRIPFVELLQRPPVAHAAFARAVMTMTQGFEGISVLINDDADLACAVGAQGMHLSSKRLWQSAGRPAFERVAALCHTAADLARTAKLALDFVFLGPVLPTASHPKAHGTGWPEFSRLSERSSLPVYALGGLKPQMIETASRCCVAGGDKAPLIRASRPSRRGGQGRNHMAFSHPKATVRGHTRALLTEPILR